MKKPMPSRSTKAKSGKPNPDRTAKPARPITNRPTSQKPVARITASSVKSKMPVKVEPPKSIKGSTAKPVAAPEPKNTNGHKTAAIAPPKPAVKPVAKAPEPVKSAYRQELPVIPADKDLSVKTKNGPVKDRIVLMVPDPYWLHVHWELSPQSVFRAEAALGQDWHGAKPIIRVFDVTSLDTTSTSETAIRDITIHGGCNHWYIDIPQPPRSYRTDIGYVSKRGQFYVLARSNVVTPPKAGQSETMEDTAWVADIEATSSPDRILAMSTGFESPTGPSQLKELFDEQFKRPIKEGAFGSGAMPGKLKKFLFEIDAELIVFGRSDPTASVSLQNEPVKLRPDGTFTMRFSLPDSRQIIPAVATSADGLEEQTIVLAVERNIKRLDPMVHDLYGEN